MWDKPFVEVSIEGTAMTWPKECACCNGTPDSHVSVQALASADTITSWKVPFCSRCEEHEQPDRIYELGCLLMAVPLFLVILFGVVTIVLAVDRLDNAFLLVFGCALVAGAIYVVLVYKRLGHRRRKRRAGYGCAVVAGVPIVKYSRRRDCHVFRFANSRFAEKVKALNWDHLDPTNK